MSFVKKTAAVVVSGLLLIGAYAANIPDEASQNSQAANTSVVQTTLKTEDTSITSNDRSNRNSATARNSEAAAPKSNVATKSKPFEETIGIWLPDATQWGLSRTRFKEANGKAYKDIVIEGYNSLKKNTNIEIDGYSMEAYYQFATDKGTYYGLTKVAYILDVSNKVSATKLKECFDSLVQVMSQKQKPSKETVNSILWELSDYNIEIAIDVFSDYNGSYNKAVAIFITEAINSNPSVMATNMRVSITATCTYNFHVGEQWTHEYYINGNRVYGGSQIKLSVGDTITVTVNTTENDKSPDYGYNQVRYTVTQEDLLKGFKLSLDVVVREDKGRYSGNTAGWTYRFSFSK